MRHQESTMRFLLVLFTTIPTLLAVTPEEKHAEFKWIDCPVDEENIDACLRVDFPGDKTDDIALLNKVDGEDTILSGFLKNENTQAISVTVYEDHMEITLHSSHDDGHSMYTVDTTTGATSVVGMPDDIDFDAAPPVPPEHGGMNISDDSLNEREIEARFVPAKGYNLRVAIFYDNSFLSFNGGSTSASNTRINSIFNHVKTIYSSFQVSGVLGAIVPSLHSVTYKSGYWTADSSLRTCSWNSNNLQWDVDTHVYITYQGNARGVVGMAWVRSTCSIYQYYRSSINEYYHTDTITAQIVAHEIGHNLGMWHDFTGNRGAKYENGQACTNIGGYMDYTINPTRWSACSVGDFTRYYQAVAQYRPNDGSRPSYPFCLQESASSKSETCLSRCTSAWSADVPSCISKDDACRDACEKGTCT